MRTLEQMGKDPRIGTRLGQYMSGAGFERIHTSTEVLPIGPWKEGLSTRPSTTARVSQLVANDQIGQASLGNEFLTLIRDMVASVSLWTFPQIARMTNDDYQALIAGAQAELQRPELKLYFNVYVDGQASAQTHANRVVATSLTGRSQGRRGVARCV